MEELTGLEPGLVRNDIHIQATYRLTEALCESEKRMRRRVELLSEVIFETSADLTISFLNRAWTNTLGYEVPGSLGVRLLDYVVPDDHPLLQRHLAAAGGSGFNERLEIRFLHRSGALVWMELSCVVLEEGGLVGALHNITQQKLAQSELAKLSLVASNTDNLVIITDAEGRTEWVNQAFTRRTGFTNEEAFGRKPGSFLQGPQTDPAAAAHLRQGVREGRSTQCEILNYTKAGEPYWVAVQISPIRNSHHQVERYVSVQTDITELRRVQQDLEAAKEAAESASEAKTQFLATISHEMRTPLNVILGTTELALEGGREAEGESPYLLRRINENAENLLRLLSDLLDISKIEAGQFEWESLPFPLRHRLRQAMAPAGERAVRKGLEFQVLIDDQLPETVLGDPTRLRQIVSNLADNAVKFTDSGFVRIEASAVRAGSTPGACGLRLRVSDSGEGIPEAAMDRIFDRFFQGDGSTTRRKGGAGLGLSIVKSLVDAMGGTVTARSVAGQGTEFHLLLPLEPVGETPATAKGHGHWSPPPPPPAAEGAARILVVEDNDDNFLIVQRHLTKNGYAVERALNGRAAVDLAASCAFDLILMDVEMPEMDGLQATQHIRAAELRQGSPATPILALTAHAVMGYRERCLAVGCTGYLAKPARKQELLDAVAALLPSAAGAAALAAFR